MAGVAGMAVEMKAQDLNFISPVTNPLFFKDANIATEIRPIFAKHYIPKSFITGGGDARLCAVQLGVAGEAGIGNPKGLLESRITVDLSYRF